MSAEYGGLRRYLAAAAERGDRTVELTFAEIDTLVGGLPNSARAYRPWWANLDQPQAQSRAWRSAGWRVDTVSLDRERVRFARDPAGTIPAASHEIRLPGTANSETPSVVLLGCVKSKRPSPAPARDLYTSPLFARRRAYAEGVGVPWFVLSSQWGLLHPDQVVGPYDMYLPAQPASYQRAWGEFVAEQLRVLHPVNPGDIAEIHAGDAYLDAVRGPLQRLGVTVTDPVDATSMGQTLQWYDRHQPSGSPQPQPEPPDGSVVPGLAARAVAVLSRADLTRTPAELRLDTGVELAQPGLYSWWVDASGAAALAEGLGLAVGPGLIYAGQAGATRWPSGQRSRNTLRTRLIGMHLDGSVEFSTFRKTLNAILRGPLDFGQSGKARLSEWMSAHLRVATWPTAEADVLHQVEAAVLRTLDPPLNLMGMERTALRVKLSQLRSRTDP